MRFDQAVHRCSVASQVRRVASNRSFSSGVKSGAAANGGRPEIKRNKVAPSEYKSAR
ncbi:MAG: hypothetical protein R3C56_03970 [Pirellulaceae bacterium]